MKKKWTRRKFLRSSIALGGAAVVPLCGTAQPAAPPSKASSPASFDRSERELLRAAMDEIIPASDGMPSASEAGGLEYLDRVARDPEIKNALSGSLAALQDLSRNLFKKDFVTLERADRVRVLARMDKPDKQAAPATFGAAADPFATLRDAVYESYYTRPQVWKLIGYEFHGTDQSGPQMKPFNESVLAQARKMPKLYREVS